ncbi:hypothetical protein PoB_001170600 [Plakobranchus ocellatus]|uniref:Uncharacterized protein n=1 Tax=Plakobranchus ocellatus TaxID=259542 RepID=A0AAV3YPJ4_9GAST|nr:hypothetical protein PoB_001170600 [Plakobranchus ocellatus]
MKCGSGFEEAFLDSENHASVSVGKLMKGKHYNRSLRMHKTVLEAVERLLFSAFQQHEKIDSLGEMAKEELNDISDSNSAICDERISSLKELLNVILQLNRMFVTVSWTNPHSFG